jgi:pantoate--beta-alanine ligase
MEIVAEPDRVQAWALEQRAAGRRIGLVPTMGFLHEGHLRLVDLARAESDRVVVSVFVNPAQFGPNEDFDRYPRDLDRDAALCCSRGTDLLFAPLARAMYAADHSVYVAEERLSQGLCGASRPGHFRGVCTVVCQLFQIVQPHVAVFGRKDAQQAAVIGRLVRDLHIPVRLIVAPIVREPDGLAMSSRNVRLDPAERARALGLSRALRAARRAFDGGARDAGNLCRRLTDSLAREHGLRVDYVTAVDAGSLEPVETLRPGVLVAIAAFAGATRLIDNTVLGVEEPGLDDFNRMQAVHEAVPEGEM